MYCRQLESLRGPRQQRFEVFERSGCVTSLCKIRADSLAKRLAEIEPQPDLSTQQIDEQLRVDAANVMVTAAGWWLDPVEPLVDVKFLWAG